MSMTQTTPEFRIQSKHSANVFWVGSTNLLGVEFVEMWFQWCHWTCIYDVRNVKPTSSVDMFSEKFQDFASCNPNFPIRIFQAFHTQHYQHLNILQLGLVQPGESISSMIGIFPFLTNRWAKWASAFGYGRYFAYVWTVVVPLGWRWVHEKSMKLPEIQEIYCRSMVYMEIWNKLK